MPPVDYPQGCKGSMQSSRMKPVLDWDKYKLVIAHLYQYENRPLRDVMGIMSKDHSFLASPKQYKDQLKKWGMMKNLNKEDVVLCLYALEDIEKGGRRQEVLLRDRVITRADINTYLKKTKKREESLRTAVPRPNTWPSHITFRSPPSQLETPPSLHEQQDGGQGLSPFQHELVTPPWTTPTTWNVSSIPNKGLTPRSSLSQRTSISSMHVAHPDTANMAEEGDMALEYRHLRPTDADELMEDVDSYEDDEVSAGDMATICAGLAASDGFGVMVRQAVAPKLLPQCERPNPLFFTLLSKSAPSIYHQDRRNQKEGSGAELYACEARSSKFVLPDCGTFVTSQSSHLATDKGNEDTVSTDLSVSFLRQCLSVCIVQGQGFREAATSLVHSAVQLFRNMIAQKDPYSLTALNLLITVLESVGQRSLAETVLGKILETAPGHSRSEGPVFVTIRFMLEITGGHAKESEYDANRMWQVYHELCELWGADSPSALTGMYHVAWSLALDAETRGEAWSILEPLKSKCEKILGQSHFQTITVMTTLARVFHHFEEHWSAASMINEAIQRLKLMYEDFHPVSLEMRSRQAVLLMKLEGSHDVQTILQDVLKHQIAILGLENPRTQSTLRCFRNFSKRSSAHSTRNSQTDSATANDSMDR